MSFFLRLRDLLISPFGVLLAHRRTIEAFVRQDIRARYVASVLGLSWAVIQPLTLLILYTFIFSYVLKVRYGAEGTTASFGAYLFCGLLPWFAFSESVARSASILIVHTNLIKKVVFPSGILPAYVVVSAIVTELFGLAVFCIIVALFYKGLGWHVLLLPVVMVVQFLLTMGVAWFVSSINVFLRDVGQALGLVLTAWMFLTPIFYPPDLIPERFRFVTVINPMHYIVQAYRDLILDQRLPTFPDVLTMLGMALLSFVFGYWFFRRSQKAFAEVL